MQLAIPYIKISDLNNGLEEVSAALDNLGHHQIQKLPWPEFIYKPEVSFCIAHTNDSILLKYFVKEKAIRAVHYQDNSPVHEDSCVEFFLAIDDNEEYYNIEFNCAGACLFGFGKNASNRKLIGADNIRKIRRLATIKSNMNGTTRCICWELAAVIPVDALAYHQLTSLKNVRCRVNFYKCGDKLPEPHFLAWQEVKNSAPDFHLANYFGEAYFEG
jgi:hypothetical protein